MTVGLLKMSHFGLGFAVKTSVRVIEFSLQKDCSAKPCEVIKRIHILCEPSAL